MNTRALARCYTCQLASSSAAASVPAPLLSRQALRLASTATKPAKAPKAKPAVDVAAVPKKKISTKSTTRPAAPKTTTTTATRKKAAAASAPAAALETAAAPAAPAKRSTTTTRASSTKATSSASAAKSATTTATKKKAAATTTTTRKASSSSSSSKQQQQQEPPASDLRKKTPSAAKDALQAARPSDSGAGTPLSTPGTTSSGEAGASRNPGVGTAPRPSATNAPPSRSDVLSSMHKDKPSEPPVHPDKPATAADPSGGAGGQYKQAASRYTRLMVALPILLVTSYYLFDRCESSLF
ncbi:uncharacterized protein E0L32_010826 [Thyridium curvatum]|uniref:Uncharacterized protein n=1 Tax=Thyridium curvatum TaxID=1093900 RepID=A0A507AF82_9PEZI|nr:uncharacterized protein E0L32_010826 [Thyridium curvatum]TPX07232.1 hypothetical protein E0L32_010826 [Thyridium curvatum]